MYVYLRMVIVDFQLARIMNHIQMFNVMKNNTRK